jgi:hypothetical protein
MGEIATLSPAQVPHALAHRPLASRRPASAVPAPVSLPSIAVSASNPHHHSNNINRQVHQPLSAQHRSRGPLGTPPSLQTAAPTGDPGFFPGPPRGVTLASSPMVSVGMSLPSRLELLADDGEDDNGDDGSAARRRRVGRTGNMLVSAQGPDLQPSGPVTRAVRRSRSVSPSSSSTASRSGSSSLGTSQPATTARGARPPGRHSFSPSTREAGEIVGDDRVDDAPWNLGVKGGV